MNSHHLLDFHTVKPFHVSYESLRVTTDITTLKEGKKMFSAPSYKSVLSPRAFDKFDSSG